MHLLQHPFSLTGELRRGVGEHVGFLALPLGGLSGVLVIANEVVDFPRDVAYFGLHCGKEWMLLANVHDVHHFTNLTEKKGTEKSARN